MKKVIKGFRNFFRNLIRFIDKKIVIPVSRLVLTITNRFDKSGRRLENWLTKTNTLLFISLFISVAIFVMIDQKILVFSDNTAEVLKNQEVTAIYNSEAYVVEGIPETVDITLIGSKTDLYIAKQSSSNAITIDLSGLKPGTHKVNIEYTQNTGSLEYMVNPSVATVIIYPKVSETRTLTVDLLNQDSLDNKYVIDSVNYDTDKIVIKGAEHQLAKVAEVKALVNIENLVTQEIGTTTLKSVALKAYDSDGNVVDVEIVPSTIDVELTIKSPSKELPIKVIPTGEVSFGLAISSIELSATKVTVYGDSAALAELNYIPVEIDVSSLKEDKTYKIELTKPVGVKSLSINNITVNVALDEIASKDLAGVSIEPKNLADGYTVQAVGEASSKVTVNLKGVQSVINAITAEDVSAYVDLTGLGAGEHEVEVEVEGNDSKVTYTSKTKKVTIKIEEI